VFILEDSLSVVSICNLIRLNKIVLRLFFIISLLLIVVSGFYAQQNQIVVENKIWSNVREDCLPEGNIYTTFYHRFQGDTTIEDRQYKKVMIAEDELYQEWYFSGSFIREDSGRVYFMEYSDEEEGLIYDFNLKMGDTVTINNPLVTEGLLLTLTTIDSIETISGYRTRWKLEKNEYSTPEYWIEGIGSQSGVLNSGTGVFGPLCGAYTLLCEKEDNITIYQNPDYETCFYILLEVEDRQIEDSFKFEVRYSRSGEQLNILFNNSEPKNVQIASLTGIHVFKTQTHNQQISLDKSKFSAGLYIISVIQNGKAYSRKVMIY